MKYVFVDESWEDYVYWQETDKKMARKIKELLKEKSKNKNSWKLYRLRKSRALA
jgi:Txe/YoeB family toxin of Txe-Axe toxin-antitoxin module